MISQYPAPPTPEALRDTGQVDGIPVRTMADVEREERERFARIAAAVAGYQVNPPALPKAETVRNDGTPVQCLIVLHDFPSKSAAARFFGVTDNAIYYAVERGGQCCGMWWRYSDMPPEVQPLRGPLRRPVIRDDGERFASMADVVRAVVGANMDRRTRKREYMRLRRMIDRRKPYRGHIYCWASDTRMTQ